jgi:hypothetical protein
MPRQPGQDRRYMLIEQFRRWVRTPVSMSSMPDEFHRALYETENLPPMTPGIHDPRCTKE